MRLLIVSCGALKRPYITPVAAIDLYDGPTYRVMRAAIQAKILPSDLKILILSAKYGILEAGTIISNYDQKMTPETAEALRPGVEGSLRDQVAKNHPTMIHLVLSKLYRQAFPEFIRENAHLIHAEDRALGFKLQTVKKLVTGVMQ